MFEEIALNNPMDNPQKYDVIILGAGAAGLFCAMQAGARGKRVLALDHAEKLGEKIRISGGGRCNFTNKDTTYKNFLSQNPKFAISALSRFTPQDFIKLVDGAGIKWHEKKLGQLFCDGRATQIVDLLLDGCAQNKVNVQAGTEISRVEKQGEGFIVETSKGVFEAANVVVATGGKSIPKIGATGFGYQLAEQFGLKIIETQAALVPFTLEGALKEMSSSLSGVSVEGAVSCGKTTFNEAMLFTHRGLSGPAILQISSYWDVGEEITLNLLGGENISDALKKWRDEKPKSDIKTALSSILPARLASYLVEHHKWHGRLADWSNKKFEIVANEIHQWKLRPSGTEGYRTAEVTRGGVDTNALNSKTMEVKSVKGLYFIGEVVDVTGWLGGYNFQWAWASGYAAGVAV